MDGPGSVRVTLPNGDSLTLGGGGGGIGVAIHGWSRDCQSNSGLRGVIGMVIHILPSIVRITLDSKAEVRHDMALLDMSELHLPWCNMYICQAQSTNLDHLFFAA